MTEQTESMTKLLREVDGKLVIVGYEYKHKPHHCGSCENDNNNNLIIEHSDNLEIFDMPHEHCQPILDNKDLYIPHDSFNLSFKFGDEWIFEGDKVELKISDLDSEDTYKGEIVYEDFTFAFKGNEDIYSNPIHEYMDADFHTSITVTGNIYGVKNE